ncbi:MAG: tetratricopeptide repeat protein [Chlamydiia bacterium]|nr:tetratricopeptide repeat protein [Chlamydiia bacterium]
MSNLDKLDKMSEEQLEKLGSDLAERVSKGEHVADLMGFDKPLMDYLYESGRYAYNSSKYIESLRVFALLLTLDRNNNLYRFGYASCMQALELYPEAIEFLVEVGKDDPKNTEIDIAIAKCFFKLNNKDMANAAIDNAIKNATKDGLIEKAKQIKEEINK